ncbi:MAG: selenide, water dikinase SelD [Bacteroidia bacterium]|nr:selenide, water dikinase SelD [Bacteroidia bacterium]
MTNTIKLTEYSKIGGCSCKIAPEVLHEILKTDVNFIDVNLLIGNATNDDAAVYNTNGEDCVISTTDFFTPVVNDAFDYGRIAATNAISDVYAMGGKPIMALAILVWPVDKLPIELAQDVLNGARNVCSKAGIVLAGGHSINGQEPMFGLAVTGTIKKQHLKKNCTPQQGNLLYITKPIGSGVLTAALKRNILPTEHYLGLINTMTTLNTIGAILGEIPYVHALTDITGFGLIGHLIEMVQQTNVTALINKNCIPLLEGVDELTKAFVFPDNTTRNYNAHKHLVTGMQGLDFLTLCDPQTSGGLLIAVNANNKAEFEKLLEQNTQPFYNIGSIVEQTTEFKIQIG